MDENNSIQLFEDRKIRTAWDEEKEEWFFSVQDVVAVLSESADPKQYIKKMRARDPQLSANWGTICTPVQMPAAAAMLQAWRGKRWKPKPAAGCYRAEHRELPPARHRYCDRRGAAAGEKGDCKWKMNLSSATEKFSETAVDGQHTSPNLIGRWQNT